MASDLSRLDLLVIQLAAHRQRPGAGRPFGIDGEGHKHPLAPGRRSDRERCRRAGAHRHLIERGLNPKHRRWRQGADKVIRSNLRFTAFSPVITPKSFPVNFDNEFRLKPAMIAAFASDCHRHLED
jgi:hypothetical protein